MHVCTYVHAHAMQYVVSLGQFWVQKRTDPTHHSLCPSHSYLMGPFMSLHSTIGTATVRPVPLSAGVGRGSSGAGTEEEKDIN